MICTQLCKRFQRCPIDRSVKPRGTGDILLDGWKVGGEINGIAVAGYKNKLSCDFAHTIDETLKWLTQLPALMQNHSGGDSVTSRC